MIQYSTDISILVVTHNHSEFIDKLIGSLEQFEHLNVYFCDAASNDGTLEKLEKSRFRKNLLSKTKLEGFSKNNNDLIRHFNLDTSYYLLLNPDTYFDVDFIHELKKVMQNDSSIAIATPLLKYPDGTDQVSWKKFPGLITVMKKRLGLLKASNEEQMKGPIIDWCLGACMLISKRLLKDGKVLLDERYRLYCEDIDICFEAKQKNLKVVGVSSTYIYHNLNEKSSKHIFSKYNRWNVMSILKFMAKWNYKYFVK